MTTRSPPNRLLRRRIAPRIARSAVVGGAAFGAATCDARSLFTTVGGQLQATAAIIGNGGTNAFVPVTRPGPGSDTASHGGVVCTVGFAFVESPGYSRLDLPLAEDCSYPLGNGRASAFSDAHFTAAAGTPFHITGIVSVPLDSIPSEIHFSVSLLANPGGTIFQHTTVRGVYPGSSIILGQTISSDLLIGSPNGVLAADTTYTMAYTIYTNDMSSQVGMRCNGTISIALGVPPCYSDCDASSTPPVLNANDFVCFLNQFVAGSSYANCDGSSVPPVLNSNDFSCFLTAFAAACP